MDAVGGHWTLYSVYHNPVTALISRMKKIPLTQGKAAIVDDENFSGLSAFRWRAQKSSSGKYYACRSENWKRGKRPTTHMHREVLRPKDGEQVDHINGDTLDNRRENLRICGQLQNSYNRTSQKNNTSGFKGVSELRGKFVAYIAYNGKQRHIGCFDTAAEAASAYDEAALKFHGEFASLNTPGNLK
jgi:hypothetical protein